MDNTYGRILMVDIDTTTN